MPSEGEAKIKTKKWLAQIFFQKTDFGRETMSNPMPKYPYNRDMN